MNQENRKRGECLSFERCQVCWAVHALRIARIKCSSQLPQKVTNHTLLIPETLCQLKVSFLSSCIFPSNLMYHRGGSKRSLNVLTGTNI